MHSAPMRNLFACAAMVVTLSACILVDDFSFRWKEGKTDRCLVKISEELYYSEFRRDPLGKELANYARSFTLGKFHFLMLKQNEKDTGGRMYRFGVENGIFQRYRLKPTMRKTFEESYPNAPVSLARDTVTLEKLGTEELKLLREISNNPSYWEIEDQILYNVARNPACIYEDRDLKALAEQEKSKGKQ